MSAPVSAGTTHCSAESFFCARTTSIGVSTVDSVPEAAGTAVSLATLRPSRRL
jgi:hypothetical protein